MSKIENLVVRRMTREDIGRVLEVERACFSHPWSEDVFSATLLLPYAHYYVAEIEGDGGEPRIIGECGVRDIVGEGEITNVAVHPDWQGIWNRREDAGHSFGAVSGKRNGGIYAGSAGKQPAGHRAL